jgi:DNA helicase HerA-like ATPase
MPFRWPNTQQRTLVLGSTGSGKSVNAAFILANQPIDKMPYVVLDYKNEELLNAIPRVRYLDFHDTPKEPGIYILPCTIESDDKAVEKFLSRIHVRGKTGLFYDEGFMLPHKPPFKAVNAIYTQGRSKHIPVITLSQRPNWISRFAFSEADHIVYMRLNDDRDQKTVSHFTPNTALWDLRIHPQKYHSKWFDVHQNESFTLLPVPKPDDILNLFEDRLKPRKKVHL